MGLSEQGQSPPLASFSLTHVHYNPEDPISFLSAFLALTPHALLTAYVTLIYATREIEILLLFAGQLSCEALNFVLKRILKEERPPQILGQGYGMPSSHAQFMGFFAVSMSLFLALRYTEDHPRVVGLPDPKLPGTETGRPGTLSVSIRALTAAAVALSAIFVGVSRIYLSYHTPRQVVYGALAGAVYAVLWFFFVEILRRSGCIDWVLDLPIVQWGRWRDLVVTEDLVQAGWEKWQAERARRRIHVNSESIRLKSQ